MKNEKEKDKNSAIVLLSGGQDSTTCLFWAMNNYQRIIAISYNFGQKNIDEIECAKQICMSNNIEHIIYDLKIIEKFKDNKNYISGRNLFFIIFAASIAKQKNIKNIIIGVSQVDFGGFSDCCDTFIKSLNVTLNVGMDDRFSIITPLIDLNKCQIWEMADKLGIVNRIISDTLTCYNGIKGKGCGRCPACESREAGYRGYINNIGKEKND